MDERVMQFRIGMFVIVAGLVLSMLLVWFGESPALFRDHRYLVVHYDQAPGVSEGIPIRKSGIRIGEVVAIVFDPRPDQPDGVLVTLALESKYELRDGSTPRITRGLIGDVWIDMLPGASADPLPTSTSPAEAMERIVEGAVAPDPSNALAAATEAFQDVKGTLKAIEQAALGLAGVTKKGENLDEFLISFRDMGLKIGALAERLDKIVTANEGGIQPAVASLRQAAERISTTLDPETQANLQQTAQRLASGSARLDQVLASISPLAADLGGKPSHVAQTAFGQAVMRINRISYDLNLLTNLLSDGQGGLNRNGSLQKFLTQPELYNNLTSLSTGAGRVVALAERTLANLNRFAERIANDPGVIGRGALQR